ncbi:MAG: hypothetical protein WDZ91_04140 [Paenibacillaceae bacterium]
MAGPTSRIHSQKLSKLVQLVKQAANDISQL